LVSPSTSTSGMKTVRQCGGGAAAPGLGVASRWSPSRWTLPAAAPGALTDVRGGVRGERRGEVGGEVGGEMRGEER